MSKYISKQYVFRQMHAFKMRPEAVVLELVYPVSNLYLKPLTNVD